MLGQVIDAQDECEDDRSNLLDIERRLADFAKVLVATPRDHLELYVISEMERRMNQELREKIIQRLVDEAQGLSYEQILDRINLRSDDAKDSVRNVWVWTICSAVPLSLLQLLEAVPVFTNLFDEKLDRDGIRTPLKATFGRG
ncbi:hypothetical protein SBOR_2633 [Sclerotinia borealis F-4128]|uniref:Uncharacterized protein n=1 Tax=Sclerotinia borealis (strain F-4128) TaxID=1432307 RepID=W9CJN1_SCLBF|nr:hypothetical protein SBOR_2633 [Sclerotinia borealis F-4128]